MNLHNPGTHIIALRAPQCIQTVHLHAPQCIHTVHLHASQCISAFACFKKHLRSFQDNMIRTWKLSCKACKFWKLLLVMMWLDCACEFIFRIFLKMLFVCLHKVFQIQWHIHRIYLIHNLLNFKYSMKSKSCASTRHQVHFKSNSATFHSFFNLFIATRMYLSIHWKVLFYT